ncbi:MAG TPA: proline dehydrogenase family protein [Natronoarchaeum rubrum]|nr:proline dehydrogenase family protein [Natronoarchaeum rubrum]
MIPPIADNFVAGETAPEAIERALELDGRGVGTILNLLGEHYERPGPAAEDRDAYVRVIEDLDDAGVEACVSIKPSQLGLDVGESTFRSNLDAVAETAAERDAFVWIDMEDHETTDATLDAFEDLAREHEWCVGVCLQANLKRTREDLARLIDVPGKFRLVKGAYDEPEDIAYTRKSRVDEEYRELLRYAFANRDRGVGVGSHDPAMIEHASALAAEHGTDFEIQMLMGVRESAQFDLTADHTVYQYVPYGDRWLSYFYRRAAERRENALFAMRAALGV